MKMALTIDEIRARVKRIFIVMMENRSFDHVLGHLSLPGIQPAAFKNVQVNGLNSKSVTKDYSKIGAEVKNPRYRNPAGPIYFPHHMRDFCPTDLPHSRESVRTQINGGQMDGFVRAYLDATQTAVKRPDPMGFLTAQELPTSTLLATQFAICDRWHAPIPTDTQPNRLMAISGFTRSDSTNFMAPDQDTVFDWLTRRIVSWRVYSAGISFYVLMKRLWPQVLSDQFRPFNQLRTNLREEGAAHFPTVTFIEPSYASDPFHATVANDNHPPAVMAAGEAFLASVYRTLTTSKDVFADALLVITYDEHGGFFDHVPPPSIDTTMPAGGKWQDSRPFTTLGVRVPAFLISPYAKAAAVFPGLCDHTSILQLFGELFADGEYSSVVTQRHNSGTPSIESLSAALSQVLGPTPRRDLPAAPNVSYAGTSTPLSPVPRAIDESFAAVAKELRADPTYRQRGFQRFPELEQFLS